MKAHDLIKLGLPRGEPVTMALKMIREALIQGIDLETFNNSVRSLAGDPDRYLGHPFFGPWPRR
ncbi:MAG: hypothetical protein HQK55_09425 [Deltaproteobacteria bacterium]|nr:hypothetical protein [Deltaproteobacteria bacterium]